MVKSLWFRLFSPLKMESVSLQDKNEAGIFTTDITYAEYIASEHTNCENGSTDCKSSVWIKIVLVVLVCISVSFNVAFIVTMVQGRFNDNSKSNVDLKINEVCLSCTYFDDIAKYSLQKNVFAYRRKSEKKESEEACCFEYNDSLHEMSKIFQLERLTTYSFSKNESQNRPAAHLTLDPHTLSEIDSRLRWNTDENQTTTVFMRHVQYADDKFVIQEEGVYYVYSFITFRSEHIKNETFLNHYVYRNTNQQGHSLHNAEMIFMDKQMRQRGNLGYQTSLLAGIVKLESRDRIYTEVSDIKAVYRSTVSNYVGLFKL